MKKIISVIAVSMLVGSMAMAYFQPATLTNGVKKVAVYSQEQAAKYFGRGFVLDDEKNIGAVPGTTHTQLEYFKGGMVDGGINISTTTGGTIPATWITKASVITKTGTGDDTITAPASTTLKSILTSVGDSKSFLFVNNSAVGVGTSTFAGATGVTLMKPETTGADVIIEGANRAMVTFIRISATAFSMYVTEYVAG